MTPSPKEAFTQFRRKQIAELRPWQPGDEMAGISVSAEDTKAGSPKHGDMIARNPKNHADQWLVAAAYFADNFEPVATKPDGEWREAIAAAFAKRFPTVLAQYSQYKIVDWFLASGLVQDEAAIRADEREKCAKIAESPDIWQQHEGDFEGNCIATAIRSARDGGEDQ